MCDSYCLQHLFSLDSFVGLTRLQPYKFCFWTYEFCKNHPQRKLFCNVNLSYLENVLQKKLRAGRSRESVFRIWRHNFENVPAWSEPWWCLSGFNVCTDLPKKLLDTSLKGKKYISFILLHWLKSIVNSLAITEHFFFVFYLVV